jgi:hypothetical protein
MARRLIASSRFQDGESLRKSIRPVCGQSPGLDEYPRVPVLITETAFEAGFFVRPQVRR